jgi:PPP family 3-phenylpropionic acid transporter
MGPLMPNGWPFAFYFWQFAGVAFASPFVVLYFQSLGFSGLQIGLLIGISPVLVLVSAPLWTGLADATRRHRLVLSLTLFGSSLAVASFPFLRAFLPVLILIAGFSIVNAAISPLADNATLRFLGDNRDMYGRQRLGGTVGYALAAPIAGQLVQSHGLAAAFWGCALMYLCAVLASQKLWSRPRTPSTAAPARGQEAAWGGVRVLMTNARWLLFLVAAFAGGLASSVINSYLFPYLRELGTSEATMGFALTLGTVLEVPMLFFGNRLLRWLKAYPLFLAALLAYAGRMLLMAAASTTLQALFVQLLNGLTFPLMWLAGVAFADESAPPGLGATAQGLFGAAIFGVGTAVGGFAGGTLLGSFGAHTLFLVFGLTVLTLALVVALAGRLLPSARPKRVMSSERAD